MKATLICLVGMMLFLYCAGFRFNPTPSLPKGIYRIVSGTPERGDFIAFCLKSPVWTLLAKERGYLAPGSCPSGLRPLLKQVVGMPGDAITIESDAIHLSTISGSSRWPAARHEDSAGRLLPGSSLESGMIPDGMCLALSDHPGSFDSRFFGLVPLADVVKVKPVFTIKE